VVRGSGAQYHLDMPPLRIAVLCEYPSLNGGERSLLAVIDQLPRPDFEFVVVAPPVGDLADELHARAIPHVPFSVRDQHRRVGARDALIDLLRRIVDETQPQLFHANSLAMGRLTGAASPQLSIPCTAHLRDILNLSGAAVADLNRNRRLVAVSRATREHHVAQGLDASRIDVIHNGADCDAFAPRERTGSLRSELGLPPNAFLVAAIGQIGLRKGLDVLAEAAVLNRDPLPCVHYLIVGERHSAKAESVQFEQSLIDTFAQAGMQDRLLVLGRRDDVPRLLNEIDLLVHPARQEPFGRVLLEAAASGVPIVATDVGGTRELLGENAAWLVPAGDAATLAAAICEAFYRSQDRESRQRRARERVLTRFRIDERAAETGRFWHSVAGHG
jgi:glycosyltransferase involved in cell wall biosynthesis